MNPLFALRRFAEGISTPLNLSLALLALGLVWRRRAVVLAGFLLLLSAASPAVSNALGSYLENQYPHLRPEQCPAADAVVALGGFAGEKKQFAGEIDWYDAVDRFESAVQLYRAKKAPVIILPATEPWPGETHTIGALLRDAAIAHGVPASAIRLTPTVRTTADEADFAREYLRDNGGRRVILVTSAAHMGRAVFLFRKAGIDVVPFPVDYQSEVWEWRWDYFIPSAGVLEQTGAYLHEIYGDLVYGALSVFGPRIPPTAGVAAR